MSAPRRFLVCLSTAPLFACWAFVAGCAAGADSDVADVEAPPSEVATTPALDATLPGFTGHVDLYVHPEERSGADVWVVHGRTSKNITSALAFDAAGNVGQTSVPSARVFEITLDPAEMQALVEDETRIFVRLHVSGSSAPIFATMTFAPRLRNFIGSSKIYALSEFRPVLVGANVLFRGTVGVASGVTKLAVHGPVGPAAALVKESTTEYSFDFGPAPLVESARATTPTMRFLAKYAGAPIEKDGTLSIDVGDFALTTANPATAFPDPPCDPAVEQCLEALPAGQADTGSCGTAKEVRTCRASYGD
jgi:hypothetical protein